MRTAFITTLESLAGKNKNIFLLNGDLGFSVLEHFTKKFPRRAYNMGVAEANMMGVAAGLAMSGKTVFVYSIIPFVTSRVFEQVRNDIALQKANVKIVGVGSGLTYGPLGPTHHAIEDLAIMRALPNMIVVAPGDPKETAEATKAIVSIKGPVYLRIGKKGEPEVYRRTPRFSLGKGIVVKTGNDCAIITTGNMLYTGVIVFKKLQEKRLRARLIALHTVKPLDERIINIGGTQYHRRLGQRGCGSACGEQYQYPFSAFWHT